MATIAGGALAGAVASAGGLGLIGGGYGDLAWIEQQFATADHPDVGVGLITWAVQDQPDVVERLAEIGVRTFLLSFGDPSSSPRQIHDVGGRSICQVQTIAEAKHAASAGADAIVAQGNEAGGHGRDNEPADDLAARILAALPSTPTLIAGGKASGADLADAWQLGAAGIVVGTAMYATTEALDTPAVKERLVAATEGDTVRTTVFDLVRGPEWPPGYNGRSLTNDTTERWQSHEEALRSEPRRTACPVPTGRSRTRPQSTSCVGRNRNRRSRHRLAGSGSHPPNHPRRRGDPRRRSHSRAHTAAMSNSDAWVQCSTLTPQRRSCARPRSGKHEHWRQDESRT